MGALPKNEISLQGVRMRSFDALGGSFLLQDGTRAERYGWDLVSQTCICDFE
jgi:hypothetical protein